MNINPETKNNLIKAGIRLFALNDYSDISVDQIVSEAEISKGSFYYYFKSKEEFYKAILQYAFDNFISVYNDQSKQARNNEELLYGFIKSVFISYEKDRNMFFLIQKELVKIVTGEKSEFLDYQKQIFQILKNILPNKEELLYYLILGIIRSSIIFEIDTKLGTEYVLNKSWFYIKKLIN